MISSQLMAHEVVSKTSDDGFKTLPSAAYLSVADNIKAMDTDHDGIVSVHEMRVFIESTRGQGYKKSLFDAMEASANSRSCGSAFSGSLY
jgi:hypothetical protein